MLTFDYAYFLTVLPKLAAALPYTFGVIAVSALLGLAAGFVVAAVRIARTPVLAKVTDVWLSFVRSMPFVLLMFLVYFTLPVLLGMAGIGNGLPKLVYVFAAMILAYAPVLAEVMRPAYLAVDKGQQEAALAFGLSQWQCVRRIIIPQALPIALPGLVNQLIEIVKDTSLIYMLGMMDLMGRANLLIHLHQGRGKLEVYIAVGILYWIIIGVLELLAAYVNRRAGMKHDLEGRVA